MRINTKRFLSEKVVFCLVIFSFGLSSLHGQIITTIAGNGVGGFSENGGPASAAEIIPNQIAMDIWGNIYISDYDTIVRKIDTSGIISAFAGNGYPGGGYSGDGGPATAAELEFPAGMATDDSGNVFIADEANDVIRKVNTSGIISTFAGIRYYGSGGGGYSGDGGPATAAEFDGPRDVAIDKSGNVYIADTYNQVIRQVNTSGIISTFAGNGYTTGISRGGGYSGDGGPATAAEFWDPASIAVDKSGNVYIADMANSRIRKVSTSDTITTIAGNGVGGFTGDGGLATAAEIAIIPPLSTLTVDDSGNIYLPDALSSHIRKVNTSGIINSIAGNGNGGFSGDGGQATNAELDGPTDVISDRYGNIYIADFTNSRIRKIWMVFNVSLNVANNVTCNGGTNGSASATASEGTPPYTYSWSPSGGSDSIASGLSAGIYTVTVTDSTGLTSSAAVTITQPPLLGVSAVLLNNLHCYGDSTGSAYATASGGNPPYFYTWELYQSGVANVNTDTLSTGSAGTYILFVYDNHCPFVEDTLIITQPPAILVSTAIISNLNNCNVTNSGIIYASVTGEFPPFTYLWSDPNHQTNDTAIGLSAGNYTITVTDSTGCTGFVSNTITLPNTSGDSVKIISNVSCYGENNGSAIIVVPPSNAVVRNYLFERAVQHFTVPVGINTISIHIGGAQGGDTLGGYGASFSGECPVIPGDILSVAVGEKGGNLYNWAGGGGGASWVYDSNIVRYSPSGATGLIAAAAGGGGSAINTQNSTIAFGEPGGTNLATNAAITNFSYIGSSGGEGGTGGNGGNVSFGGLGEGKGGGAGWLSDGERFGDTNNFGFGGYDEAHHFAFDSGYGDGGNGGFGGGGMGGWSGDGANIGGVGGGGGGYNGGGGGGGSGGSYFINTSPIVTATDTGNGFVTISYTVGGIPPFTYLWSNGETTAIATGLSAGTYSVTVSDSSGCLFIDSVTITQPPAIIPTITEYSGVKCSGDSDAVLFASASGGSGFYEYQWSDASSQTNSLATGLSIGTYSVTVSDNNGCTGTASAIITQPPSLNITADSINATNGNCNGSAWAIVNGGTNPYTYLWTGGLTTDTISNQCANYYCCTITDANGCIDSTCITIDEFTGTQQITINDGQLTVYPNPNSGIFTVTLSHPPAGGSQPIIEIYNVLGEQVLTETLRSAQGDNLINLPDKADGMYFYRVIRMDPIGIKPNGRLVGEGKIVVIHK